MAAYKTTTQGNSVITKASVDYKVEGNYFNNFVISFTYVSGFTISYDSWRMNRIKDGKKTVLYSAHSTRDDGITKKDNTYTFNFSQFVDPTILLSDATYEFWWTVRFNGANNENEECITFTVPATDETPNQPSVNENVPGLPTDTTNPETTFTRMTGEEFIDKYAIRQRISDAIETGYTDEELLAYINDAINLAWGVMIQMDYDEIAGYLTMNERKIEIPKDYWMPTGKPPVQRHNHMLYCYGDLPCVFRYWMRPKFLRTLQDTLPQGTAWFNPALLNLIAQVVVTLAMQNHGFDMGSEMDFATSIGKMLPT